MDFDATITIAHSEKQNAAAAWRRRSGSTPLLCFLDRPEIAAGEALAGLLRKGNPGSNSAADHVTVLHQALAACRRTPGHGRATRMARGCWHPALDAYDLREGAWVAEATGLRN